MGKTTLPDIRDAVSRERAEALVAHITERHSECTAYPHAWGHDWGVTICGPAGSDDDLPVVYKALVYLDLA